MIIAYDLCENKSHKASDSLSQIIESVDPAEWHMRLHELGISKAFASPKERTLDELIELVIKMNQGNAQITDYTANHLKSEVNKIKNLQFSKILKPQRGRRNSQRQVEEVEEPDHNPKPISDWDKEMI